jgi:hypothetical protein
LTDSSIEIATALFCTPRQRLWHLAVFFHALRRFVNAFFVISKKIARCAASLLHSAHPTRTRHVNLIMEFLRPLAKDEDDQDGNASISLDDLDDLNGAAEQDDTTDFYAVLNVVKTVRFPWQSPLLIQGVIGGNQGRVSSPFHDIPPG